MTVRDAAVRGPQLAPAPGEGGPVPLSEAQAGLWFAQRLDPANPVYNTGHFVDLRGPLRIDAFRDAVARAVSEADALALRVVDAPEGPRQVVDEDARPRLQVVDLSANEDPERAAHEHMRRDMDRPIDPTRDPLAAERLFVLGPERHLWYQRIHHLAIDGYGTALLFRRVLDLYAASVAGTTPRTVPFAPFAELLAAEAEYAGSPRREQDREFWRSELSGAPEARSLVPGDQPSGHFYRRHEIDLPAAVGEGLQRLSAAAGVVWPDALTALVAAYLHRHIGGEEITIGAPSMNRLGGVFPRVPAMVMNVLPVRVQMDEDRPLPEFVTGVARVLARARRHGRYRGEQIRRDLGLLGEGRRLHGPVINMVPFDQLPEVPGLETALHTLGSGPVDDLTVDVRADLAGRRLRLELQAHPERYPEAEVAAHAGRLAAFLARAVEADRLADVPTLTAAERARWVEEVNRTGHPVEDTTLAELIQRTMRRSPDAPALVYEDRRWSYAELDAGTAALRRELEAGGVGRGDVVAVLLPRSPERVVALVAIVRAGAAYLPLDPEHPPERLAALLRSAGPRRVVTSADLRALLPADAAVTLLDGVPTGEADAEPSPARPEDAAYVIFTSGSTGAPKGVVVEHRAIVNRLEWMRTHYGIGPDDRILQKTPATFDVSVWEFFLPLITGAALVVAPPEAHRDPALLARVLREQRISTLHFVPSMLSVFLDEPTAGGVEVKRVFCSGEALPAPLRDRFHERIDAELHNLYGPTEAAVDVTYWDASFPDRSSPVPIGRPVWNTRMYVLDGRLRPAPPGVGGDLYIAGIQLAREYLGRPDLTAERFIPDPFVEGERMYQTGDLAFWRPDGELVYLGRSDHQVKIRGIRIEPGEIEAAVLEDGELVRAVVIAREDRPGDQRLVAYLVPREGAEAPDPESLRDRLAARLPEPMVPSAFVVLDELPLTPNGKLNRGALPVPERAAAAPGRAPRTDTERRLARLFAEVLGMERVDADDDFFLLGGHSLLAARLVARVREEWGRETGLGAVFAHPTVSRLAAHVDALAGEVPGGTLEREGLGPLIRLVEGDEREAPLFCVHPAGGISWCYRPLGGALDPPRPVFGLQARGLDPREPMRERLDEVAADYVEEIRRVQPEGPYHLAGWSIGGILAHAMAVRLRSEGAAVALVALLDAYPSDVWRERPDPGEDAVLRALLHIAGIDPDTAPAGTLTREGVVGMLRRSGHALGGLSDAALSGVVRVVEHNNRLVRSHHHGHFDGRVVHFRAALDHEGEDLSPEQWAAYAAGVDAYDVPALHAHMILPDPSRRIAAVIGRYLRGEEG